MYWLFVNTKSGLKSQPLSEERAESFVRKISHKEARYWLCWNPFFSSWLPLTNVVQWDGKHLLLTFKMSMPSSAEQTVTNFPVSAQTTKKSAKTTKVTKEPPSKERNESYQEDTNPFLFTNIDLTEVEKQQVDPNYFYSNFTGDDLDLSKVPQPPSLNDEKTGGADSRMAKRFDLRIQVIIYGRKKSFRTCSNNISLTGAQLQDPVPAEFLNEPFEIVFIVKGNDFEQRIIFTGKIVGNAVDPRRLTFLDHPEESFKRLRSLLESYEKQSKTIKAS